MEHLLKAIQESDYNKANSFAFDVLYQKLNDKLEDRQGEIQEASDKDGDEYKKFFQSALKKFGVSSPGELEGDKKKKFYDYVDKNWKSDREKETGQEDPKESVEMDEATKSSTGGRHEPDRKKRYALKNKLKKLGSKEKNLLAKALNSITYKGVGDGPGDRPEEIHGKASAKNIEYWTPDAVGRAIAFMDKKKMAGADSLKKSLSESVELDEAKSVPLVRTGQGSSTKDTHPSPTRRLYKAKDKKEYEKLMDHGKHFMHKKLLKPFGITGQYRKYEMEIDFKDEKTRRKFEKEMSIKEGAEMDTAKEAFDPSTYKVDHDLAIKKIKTNMKIAQMRLQNNPDPEQRRKINLAIKNYRDSIQKHTVAKNKEKYTGAAKKRTEA